MSLEILALQAEQLQRDFEAGNISADEYKELVQNIGLVQAINEQTSMLEENLAYRQMILNAINIATALA